MTDVGYSSEYEVYLTMRNGIQIVTNELSLQILREMRYRRSLPRRWPPPSISSSPPFRAA